jgi:DNA-binding IclR family transcriptional regulator
MNPKKTKKDVNSRYHVPNLERALKIIELLSHFPRGLTTSDISRRLKISRNSVFRITTTLHNTGYLTRDDESKIFQLSQKLLVLGYAALSEQSLVEKALPVMQELRDSYGETIPLGILHGEQGIVIEAMQGTHSFRFVLEPGRQFHLHTSAPGKAVLAYLPEEERNRIISKIEFKRYNERTVSGVKDYLNILREVCKCGYSVDRAEEIEGMHCVGAPIFNRHGHPVAAIWITGPSSRIKLDDFDKIGPEVRRAADRISQSLGYGISGQKNNLHH